MDKGRHPTVGHHSSNLFAMRNLFRCCIGLPYDVIFVVVNTIISSVSVGVSIVDGFIASSTSNAQCNGSLPWSSNIVELTSPTLSSSFIPSSTRQGRHTMTQSSSITGQWSAIAAQRWTNVDVLNCLDMNVADEGENSMSVLWQRWEHDRQSPSTQRGGVMAVALDFVLNDLLESWNAIHPAIEVTHSCLAGR